ncbi:MAG: hypothetical protein WC144_08295 [Sulfurimonas sp.]|jgi:hypothetical protein
MNEIKEGYKIVTSDLKSPFVPVKIKGRQYYIKKWTETSLINRGALCVFDDIFYVKKYLKNHCLRNLDLRLFKCNYILAVVDKYDNKYQEFVKYPLFIRQGKQISCGRPVQGTKLARKVKLIEEIEIPCYLG